MWVSKCVLDDVILEINKASNKGQIGGVGSGGEESKLAEIGQCGAELGNP